MELSLDERRQKLVEYLESGPRYRDPSQMCRDAGLSRATWPGYTRGKRKPSETTVRALARVAGVSEARAWGIIHDEMPPQPAITLESLDGALHAEMRSLRRYLRAAVREEVLEALERSGLLGPE